MEKIRCSIFTGLNRKKPARVDSIAWDKFCDYFVAGEWLRIAREKGRSYPAKKSLPLLGFYQLDEGSTRSNESVAQVYALSLDFDSGCSVTDIESVFGDWRCAIHTTWSHTPSDPRTRLVLPLSRSVSRSEFGLLIRWAMEFAEANGLAPDPSCKDPARMWFAPCSQHEDMYEYVVFYEDDARALDVDMILKSSEPVDHNDLITMEKAPEDTKVMTYDGELHVLDWGNSASLGDKVKCSCPDMADSTIGSAFLRRAKFGVWLVCTSQNHGHDKTPHKKFLPFPGLVRPGEEEGVPEDVVLPYLAMKMRRGESTGCPTPTASNLSYILKHDTRWKGKVWLNSFDNCVWLTTPEEGDRPWKDEDDTSLSIWLTRVYGTVFSSAVVRETINLHSTRNKRNPLQERIENEEWDGTVRLEEWLLRGFGCADTPINRSISARWAIQAIARAFKPGCQADATLVLFGPQGVGKSSGLRILGGEYFSDTPMDFTKDSFLQIARAWIYEIAELDAFRGRANSQIKAFLTATHDNFRAPYKSRAEEVARHVVFAASTNESSFLSDPSGARRFWPVNVTTVDRDYLNDIRSQMWAEALVAFRNRHPEISCQWWMTPVEEELLREMQVRYQVEDTWRQLIEQHIATVTPKYVRVCEMYLVLGLTSRDMNTRRTKRVVDILTQLRFVKKRVTTSVGVREMVYMKIEEESDARSVG